MFKIEIPSVEGFDNSTNTFTTISPAVTLSLEHSLVSLSKWEAKWHKPFLSKENNKSMEEIRDYVRCMSLNSNVDQSVYDNLTPDVLSKIIKYIEEPMTATTFSESSKKSNEVITSEIIYYWMISFNIPFECQKWHLNRLLTLIRVCSIKNAPSSKMSTREILARNKALNAQRRAKLNSRG